MQLSRTPAWNQGVIGAHGRTRTADLPITNQLLYQLSYVGPAVIGPAGELGRGGQVATTRREGAPRRAGAADDRAA